MRSATSSDSRRTSRSKAAGTSATAARPAPGGGKVGSPDRAAAAFIEASEIFGEAGDKVRLCEEHVDREMDPQAVADLRQPLPDLADVDAEFLSVEGDQIGEANGDDDAVDGLLRPVLSEDRQKGQPALAVGDGVRVLRGVSAGGVDQHRVLGKPPVAVARSAHTFDGCAVAGFRKCEAKSGIDEGCRLAGPRGADDQIPGDLVEKVPPTVAALHRGDRLLHAGFQDVAVAASRDHRLLKRSRAAGGPPVKEGVVGNETKCGTADDHGAKPRRLERTRVAEADHRPGEPDRRGESRQRHQTDHAKEPGHKPRAFPAGTHGPAVLTASPPGGS